MKLINKKINGILHPCEIIYKFSNKQIFGQEQGICRVTGKQSVGLLFNSWVKKTFNDWSYLKPGTLISNEALFCFDEQSNFLMTKTGRDNPQRFRTYSHIIHDENWYCLTKADKKQIFDLICDGAEIVSLNDTGQKHIFFKHKLGFWQLDDLFILPDIDNLKQLHKFMCDLMRLGFSQQEIITGNYKLNRIELAGLQNWKNLEIKIKQFRNTAIFTFSAWMLFISENDKEKVQALYNKKTTLKQKGQTELWS